MSKQVHIKWIVVALCIFTMVGVITPPALAFDPSFPTRTPTPSSGQQPNPTATESGTGNQPEPTTSPGSPGSELPTQTGTSQAPGLAQATPTSTRLPVLGGAIRANPSGVGECSDTPYIRAIQSVVVYGGPGMNFGPVSTLLPEEMRPIFGRYGYGAWWQIEVKPGMLGWVADHTVDEFGNTALVPLVDSPAFNGATPTRGPLWNPTPLPLLTCVPTPTPTTTPTETATPEVMSTGNAVGGSVPAGDAPSGAPPAATSVEMVSAEVFATPVSPQEASAQLSNENPQGSGLNSRGSEAFRAASPTSATNLILPLVGLALIAGGIVLALLSRNRGGGKPDEPKP